MGISRAFLAPTVGSSPALPMSRLHSIIVLCHPHPCFPLLLRVRPLGRGCLGPGCGVRHFALDKRLFKTCKDTAFLGGPQEAFSCSCGGTHLEGILSVWPEGQQSTFDAGKSGEKCRRTLPCSSSLQALPDVFRVCCEHSSSASFLAKCVKE